MNKPLPVNTAYQFIRKSEVRTYSEDVVLYMLDDRFATACDANAEPVGKKNLIYFTINYNVDYIDLFFYCLRSIVGKDTPDLFDLLIICPPRFEKLINEFIVVHGVDLRGFKLMFHHVPEAVDGVDASMNKLKIYQFKDVDDYRNILFLDVDILAKEPISDLFKLVLEPNKLYSAIHTASAHLHNTKYHRILEYDLHKMNEFRYKGIYAFNAGQYLFVNNAQMRQHMDNVNWLASVWPGEYFFEQSYLNHYFNWYGISDIHLLDNYVKFEAVHLWERGDFALRHRLDYSIIHFAGHACDARKKIEYIQHFHPKLI
jgi:Glycosyl transferase family 8